MVVTGVLFGGALVALVAHREPAFWVLAGLAIAWQLLALERRR